jgi:hypothetical protein
MAEKVTFTSVQLLGFQRNADGGTANFSSSLTENVMRTLGWSAVPECMVKASPEGELDATVIDLKPNDKALSRHAITLDVKSINRFNVVRLELEQSRGKGHRMELRFTVHFTDVAGARKLEEYIQTCGKSSLAVSYTKRAVQEDLPGVEATEEQRQAALEIEVQ